MIPRHNLRNPTLPVLTSNELPLKSLPLLPKSPPPFSEKHGLKNRTQGPDSGSAPCQAQKKYIKKRKIEKKEPRQLISEEEEEERCSLWVEEREVGWLGKGKEKKREGGERT